ncbi:hypothetical protein GOBAR_DD01010 [Gossypium barbadense]|nr:hypothetical protein GOBAR_DD01010 [Gossypium barbadense]
MSTLIRSGDHTAREINEKHEYRVLRLHCHGPDYRLDDCIMPYLEMVGFGSVVSSSNPHNPKMGGCSSHFEQPQSMMMEDMFPSASLDTQYCTPTMTTTFTPDDKEGHLNGTPQTQLRVRMYF